MSDKWDTKEGETRSEMDKGEVLLKDDLELRMEQTDKRIQHRDREKAFRRCFDYIEYALRSFNGHKCKFNDSSWFTWDEEGMASDTEQLLMRAWEVTAMEIREIRRLRADKKEVAGAKTKEN